MHEAPLEHARDVDLASESRRMTTRAIIRPEPYRPAELAIIVVLIAAIVALYCYAC